MDKKRIWKWTKRAVIALYLLPMISFFFELLILYVLYRVWPDINELETRVKLGDVPFWSYAISVGICAAWFYYLAHYYQMNEHRKKIETHFVRGFIILLCVAALLFYGLWLSVLYVFSGPVNSYRVHDAQGNEFIAEERGFKNTYFDLKESGFWNNEKIASSEMLEEGYTPEIVPLYGIDTNSDRISINHNRLWCLDTRQWLLLPPEKCF